MNIPTSIKLFLFVTGLFALVAAWQWTPLAELTDPDRLAGWGAVLRGHWWGYFAALLVFVIGGIVVFPVSILVAASVLVFGPYDGFLLSFIGSLASGAVGFIIAKILGANRLGAFSKGSRAREINEALARRGIISVMLIRQIPIAPYSIINYLAGVSQIRFSDFMIGTGIGIIPWILAFTLFTNQFFKMIQSPTLTNLGISLVVLILISVVLYFVIKYSSKSVSENKN